MAREGFLRFNPTPREVYDISEKAWSKPSLLTNVLISAFYKCYQ